MAMLEKRQNPIGRSGSAWCPGRADGRERAARPRTLITASRVSRSALPSGEHRDVVAPGRRAYRPDRARRRRARRCVVTRSNVSRMHGQQPLLVGGLGRESRTRTPLPLQCAEFDDEIGKRIGRSDHSRSRTARWIARIRSGRSGWCSPRKVLDEFRAGDKADHAIVNCKGPFGNDRSLRGPIPDHLLTSISLSKSSRSASAVSLPSWPSSESTSLSSVKKKSFPASPRRVSHLLRR